MIGRVQGLLKWLLLLPVLIVVLLLSVNNDHPVRISLNPFVDAGSDLALDVELPLYHVGFAIFVVGVLCGGFTIWNNQRKYRRKARDMGQDAALWRSRAEKAEKTAPGGNRLIEAGPE